MERGSIEREIHIEASPDVVFEVVSSPEHMREWWDVEADVRATAGAVGELAWDSGDVRRAHVQPVTVVEVEPPRLFSFRWVYPDAEAAAPGNSLLVTFELVPTDHGTLLRMTETGFRENGWEVAVLEELYAEHSAGWDVFVPRLGTYAAGLVSAP